MTDSTESNITMRMATRADVPVIVAMLADDPLGATRERSEDPLPDGYYRAFDAIERSPDNHLIVAASGGQLVGVLQLTIIPYLTYQGSKRALIEGVRVHREARGKGLGKQMLGWAIAMARDAGCHVVQLTTDKKRPQALAFYQGLGFVASHEGMKLHLRSTREA
jgi:GNAT superfamily N-acetyltransferase